MLTVQPQAPPPLPGALIPTRLPPPDDPQLTPPAGPVPGQVFFDPNVQFEFVLGTTFLPQLGWPKSNFITENFHPLGRKDAVYWDDMQGVANSGKAWYIAQTKRLSRYPFDRDLSTDFPDRSTTIEPVNERTGLNYNHFGDPDFFEGLLWAPVTGPNLDGIISVWDSELRLLTTIVVPPIRPGEVIRSVPWCAMNPFNGFLYTSIFTNTNELRMYSRDSVGGALVLTPRGALPLRAESQPIKIPRAQGGAFSPNGHLYVVSDSNINPLTISPSGLFGPGIYWIDANTGDIINVTPMPKGKPGLEHEGITIVNLHPKGSKAPHIGGQVHVLTRDNNDDEATLFQHFQPANATEAYLV